MFKNKSKFENKFMEMILDKNWGILLIIFSTCMAIAIHISGISNTSGDWIFNYSAWYQELKENGGLLALGRTIGDYPYGFNFLLACFTYITVSPMEGFKTFIFLFNVLSAIMSYFIVYEINKENTNVRNYSSIAYACLLLLPSVFLNTSYWGQVDTMYIAFLLIAIYFMVKGKYSMALFFVGISLSLKQTAIFIIPVLAVLYLRENKLSILKFLNILLGFFLMSLPSILLGKSIKDVLSPYLGFGTGITDSIVVNFSNIYYLITPDPTWASWVVSDMFTKIGVRFCIFIIGIVILIMYYRKIDLSGSNILLVITVFVVIICNLLPGIHDRYMLLADVTSILYIISSKKYKNMWIPIYINFVSIFNILSYLRGISEAVSNTRIILTQLIAIVFFMISMYLVYYVINTLSYKYVEKNT
jgi:Gpi18-like mannosyltransferase